MIIPVRCFTCGKVIGNKYKAYLDKLATDMSEMCEAFSCAALEYTRSAIVVVLYLACTRMCMLCVSHSLFRDAFEELGLNRYLLLPQRYHVFSHLSSFLSLCGALHAVLL
jgi:DNA-directed RNA polymerase subunit N (RpoN/RPB10)